MTPDAPFNVRLLDVDTFIKNRFVKQVTSLSIYQPSSTTFETTGLFSEEIFGALGSSERMVTFGYVSLNTTILQPIIYKNVIKLASLYEEILTGSSYATFDPVTKNFVRCVDPQKSNEAQTGYTFFMNHFLDIEFERNESRIRSDRIDIIEKFRSYINPTDSDARKPVLNVGRNLLFCDKVLVLPAGLRDLEESQGNLTTDDINKLYQTLLSYSFSLPPGAASTIYDGVRLAIQKKAVEIYDYIENILVGKRGFIQGVWGHRKIALGTRNVITAATYATMTPNDPQTLQPDETKFGIFQTMKALQPIAVHHIRTTFIEPIFGKNSNLVPLIDPKTYELAYRSLSEAELARFQSPEAIEDWISRFQNLDLRTRPVSVECDEDERSYFLLLVYDEGDKISLFRSLSDLQKCMEQKPVAVIIKGNPAYVEDPKVRDIATAFYNEIKLILEDRGFSVVFDTGADYTIPDEKAAVWIGHSRGIDRLQYAPPGTKTIELQTADHTKSHTNKETRGSDPDHYRLSVGDKKTLESLTGPISRKVDPQKIHPLTWAEMCYMATYNAAINKHTYITRYPVIQDESCYPTKIHLCSTVPSRVVKLMDATSGSVILTYPEYPILDRPFLDSIQLGTARLKGLDGDYDGDQSYDSPVTGTRNKSCNKCPLKQ